MKYSGIIFDDFAAAPGVSLTFFTQGCPHRCKGCHNSETWDFNGGLDFTEKVVDKIDNYIEKNNIVRNFCLMGGEPLCKENLYLSCFLIDHIKTYHPKSPIYIWSGYTYQELLETNNNTINHILQHADYLIDGRYIEELRDITLSLRGSSNQKIINLQNKEKYDIIK